MLVFDVANLGQTSIFCPAIPAQANLLVFGNTAYGTLAEDASRQRESKRTLPLKGWVQGGLMETKFNGLLCDDI